MAESEWDAISKSVAGSAGNVAASPIAGVETEAAGDTRRSADWDAFSRPISSAVTGRGQPDPNAEPDAPTWLGRRWQDIRGKQDPRFKDIGVFDPYADLAHVDSSDWRTVEQAKGLGANDEGLADIYRKQLGPSFVRTERDANGYPMIIYRDAQGAEMRKYVNRPGLDWADVDRGLTGSLPYVAAGGLAGRALQGAGLAANVGGQALAGAGTSVATDVGTQLLGSDQPTDLGKAAIIGGISGAVPLVGRAIDAAARTFVPGIKDAAATARDPAAAGVKQLERSATYDRQPLEGALDKLTVQPPPGVTAAQAEEIADLTFRQGLSAKDAAARTGVPEPAAANIARQEADIQAAYRDMNVLEVLKSGHLQPTPAGTYAPEVVTTRNLNAIVQDAANTEGYGQNVALNNYLSRKQEMGGRMQADIDAHFGSGARASDDAVIAGRKAALDARYDKFRKRIATQVVKPEDFGPRLTQSPLFQQAMDYARDAEIAAPGFAGKVSQAPAGGAVDLTAANVLDMAHFLSKAAWALPKNSPEQMRAIQLKNTFQNWIDQEFSKKFRGLNEDFTTFKRILDARENAGEMALGTGAKADDAFAWLLKQKDTIPKQIATFDQKIAEAEAKAAAASNVSVRKRFANQAAALRDQRDARQAVLDEFRKAWGQSLKDEIANLRFSASPGTIVEKLLSQTGQRRILEVLGPEDGQAYIRTLFGLRTQQLTGNVLYGGPDTAYKVQRLSDRGNAQTAASHLVTLKWGGLWEDIARVLAATYRSRSSDAINRMMSAQGVDAVRSILKSYKADKAAAAPLVRPYLEQGSRVVVPMAESGPARPHVEAGAPPRALAGPVASGAGGAGGGSSSGRGGALREDAAAYRAADEALTVGVPPEKVRQRLIERGIDPRGVGL